MTSAVGSSAALYVQQRNFILIALLASAKCVTPILPNEARIVHIDGMHDHQLVKVLKVHAIDIAGYTAVGTFRWRKRV
jgi:hypothetical protein